MKKKYLLWILLSCFLSLVAQSQPFYEEGQVFFENGTSRVGYFSIPKEIENSQIKEFRKSNIDISLIKSLEINGNVFYPFKIENEIVLLRYLLKGELNLLLDKHEGNIFLKDGNEIRQLPKKNVWAYLRGYSSQKWGNTTFYEKYKSRRPTYPEICSFVEESSSTAGIKSEIIKSNFSKPDFRYIGLFAGFGKESFRLDDDFLDIPMKSSGRIMYGLSFAPTSFKQRRFVWQNELWIEKRTYSYKNLESEYDELLKSTYIVSPLLFGSYQYTTLSWQSNFQYVFRNRYEQIFSPYVSAGLTNSFFINSGQMEFLRIVKDFRDIVIEDYITLTDKLDHKSGIRYGGSVGLGCYTKLSGKFLLNTQLNLHGQYARIAAPVTQESVLYRGDNANYLLASEYQRYAYLKFGLVYQFGN